MIERLVTSLQSLASPAAIQLSRFPGFAARSNRVVLDFADSLLLARDCPQLEFTRAQMEAIGQVERALDIMSDSTDDQLWTEDGVRERQEWENVRERAMTALREMGLQAE